MFRTKILGLLVILILFVLMTFVVGYAQESPRIIIIDTNSGANFQEFFSQTVIPKAIKKLGFQIEYVVSSGPEIVERTKAWGNRKGDFHILLLKQETVSDFQRTKFPLVKLYPDLVAKIPNLTKISKENLEVNDNVNLKGTAALFWRSQEAIIYNSAKLPNPPKSWKELYERRAELKGHIGLVRPDAKSSGGRRMIYGFLNAFNVNFKKPFDQLKETKEWKDGLAKWEDFSTYLNKPLASEPPILFQQFKSEDVWISEYALDYTLWTRDRGLLPRTMKGLFFAEGDTSGADALLVIPQNINEPEKQNAIKLLNYLLSDEIQVEMITTMWQYTGTDINSKVPAFVWDSIPKWEVAKKSRIRFENTEAQKYITEQGMNHMK